MIDLDAAEAQYDALRDRDRVVASMQSKQRMHAVFQHVPDDAARDDVATRLTTALSSLRAEAHALATRLARAALVELDVDDLGRMTENLRRLEHYLEANPSEALDACHDLLTFLRELHEIEGPLRIVPRDRD